jgi:hypothetical protein
MKKQQGRIGEGGANRHQSLRANGWSVRSVCAPDQRECCAKIGFSAAIPEGVQLTRRPKTQRRQEAKIGAKLNHSNEKSPAAFAPLRLIRPAFAAEPLEDYRSPHTRGTWKSAGLA